MFYWMGGEDGWDWLIIKQWAELDLTLSDGSDIPAMNGFTPQYYYIPLFIRARQLRESIT